MIRCSDCTHYHRGRGDRKCLRCQIYEAFDRENRIIDNDLQTISLPGSMLENLADNSQTRNVLDALQRLPAEYCAVLAMRYFGGMTNSEIGEILGLADRTVRRRISRGLLIIREELKR